MSHDNEDGPCCDSCAEDLPCEVDCSDQPNMETLSGRAQLLDVPSNAVRNVVGLAQELIREVRAPVFEGKPFDQIFKAGRSHTGTMDWPTPPRGFRPQVEAIRMCRGDNTGFYGPNFPFELSLVPYGISTRNAELTINKGVWIRRALTCFSFNGGTFASSTASQVVLGGPPMLIPYDAQSGKFDTLFYKLDLTQGVTDAHLVIHDRWTPAHEVFPPGVTRRPFQETV